MLQQILPLIVIHGFSLISPGPDVFYVLSSSANSLSNGAKAALGIFFGNVVLVLFVLVLGAQIFQHFPSFFVWFKTIGSLYLCWLGLKICYGTFKSSFAKRAPSGRSEPFVSRSQTNKDGRYQVLQGALMCLTNPKAVLYFTSFLPQYLFLNGSIVWPGVVAVLLLSFAWFFFAAFFGNRFFSRLSDKMKAIINFSFGIVLVAFSALLFLSQGSP